MNKKVKKNIFLCYKKSLKKSKLCIARVNSLLLYFFKIKMLSFIKYFFYYKLFCTSFYLLLLICTIFFLMFKDEKKNF